MAKLSDAQVITLSKASQRDDGLLTPGPKGGGRNCLQAFLLKTDMARATNLQAKDCEMAWFEDEGRPVGLRIAKAGYLAINVDPPKKEKTRAAAGSNVVKVGIRKQATEAAERGVIPQPPDFSAETHKPYRKKLEALVALADAGNLTGLKEMEIKPTSTSPKALIRYRDLAIIAIQARETPAREAAE